MITHCPECEGEIISQEYGIQFDIVSITNHQETNNKIRLKLYLCRDCDWIQVKEITRQREVTRGSFKIA